MGATMESQAWVTLRGSPLSLHVVFSGPEQSFRTREASPGQRSVFIREAASALAPDHSGWESLPSQGWGQRSVTDRKRCALKCDEVGKGTSREAPMFQGWASPCHMGTVIPATPMRKLRPGERRPWFYTIVNRSVCLLVADLWWEILSLFHAQKLQSGQQEVESSLYALHLTPTE